MTERPVELQPAAKVIGELVRRPAGDGERSHRASVPRSSVHSPAKPARWSSATISTALGELKHPPCAGAKTAPTWA